MLTEYWIASDKTGKVGFFSNRIVPADTENLLLGTSLIESLHERAAGVLAAAHLATPIEPGGMFLPAFFVSGDAAKLAALSPRPCTGGYVSIVLDDDKQKEQIENAYLDPDIRCFAFRPRLSPEIALLAGARVFMPDDQGRYVAWGPPSTLLRHFQEALRRNLGQPLKLTELAESHQKRVVKMNSANFDDETVDLNEHIQIAARPITPTGLLDEADPPRPTGLGRIVFPIIVILAVLLYVFLSRS